MTKEQLVKNFLDNVDHLELHDIIEIIANILIQIGMRYIPEVGAVTTPDNIVKLLMDYRKQNGETLAGALIQQGLVMMMWLNR